MSPIFQLCPGVERNPGDPNQKCFGCGHPFSAHAGNQWGACPKSVALVSETTEWWAGKAGEDYHARNRVNWKQRLPFWARIMAETNARSVLEVGCGPGWNLTACRAANHQVHTYGIEINPIASRQARLAGHKVMIERIHHPAHEVASYDLVMSIGCLIHVPPEEIEKTMRCMIAVSAQYVLSVEYEADQDEMVPYRGEADRLWRRPYGARFRTMGLKPIASGLLEPAQGFDNCQWHLLEKP